MWKKVKLCFSVFLVTTRCQSLTWTCVEMCVCLTSPWLRWLSPDAGLCATPADEKKKKTVIKTPEKSQTRVKKKSRLTIPKSKSVRSRLSANWDSSSCPSTAGLKHTSRTSRSISAPSCKSDLRRCYWHRCPWGRPGDSDRWRGARTRPPVQRRAGAFRECRNFPLTSVTFTAVRN